ncbi:hypothetical protein LUI11_32185 [Bradyrhizobium diazoefficiens]|nr:hypothetical protein [Bradyrhizobium diazoefficiens]APO49685.1 hypothetical protein BD122_05610 [Bradyrhizobium diazoefficiens]KOY12348.1 hypothetical protein AF336_04250 [Bradyrhizobium diazoefficiens]MCD9296237.1 hypothetical protein [Bradyrhizobium diazoefficiens]MCD9813045.1 hypothetical protein [Bradyrhizobium diazoefficiens]MCD9831770.1 hypothetical protein [Bradyrhizobium diazoefficiens]
MMGDEDTKSRASALPSMSHTMPAVPREPEQVFLIHGTGSSLPDPENPRWWQSSSDFARRLAGALGDGFRIGDKTISATGPDTFTWSGANSERARRSAGTTLLGWLIDRETANRGYHLIAHSHGGSVIWHALVAARRAGIRLRGLRSWTTVGTPFLHFDVAPLFTITALTWVVSFLVLLPTISRISKGSENFYSLYDVPFTDWLIPSALLFLLAAILVVPLLVLLTFMLRKFETYRLGRIEQLTYSEYEARHLAIWHEFDEPINGIGATLSTPAAITPRLVRADATPRDFRLHPGELARLSLPFRKLYDLTIAAVADQFAWRLLMKRLQGSDIPGLLCSKVDTLPALPRSARHPLPPADAEAMNSYVKTWTSDTADDVRRSLHRIRLSGNGADLLNSLPPRLWDSVLHTSYFTIHSISDRIAQHVLKMAEPREPSENDQASPATHSNSSRSRSYIPWKLWLLSGSTLVALTALTATAFNAAFDTYLWPASRDYQLERIITRVTDSQFLAIPPNDHIGKIYVNLLAMDRLGDYMSLLDRMSEADLAIRSAERLAFAFGHAERWDDVKRLSSYSRGLARGDERWERVVPVILLQGIAGAIAKGLPANHPKVQEFARLIAVSDVQQDEEFIEFAIPMLLTLGRDDVVKELMENAESLCIRWAEHLRKETKLSSLDPRLVDRCKEDWPEAFESSGISPEVSLSERRDASTSKPQSDPVQLLKRLEEPPPSLQLSKAEAASLWALVADLSHAQKESEVTRISQLILDYQVRFTPIDRDEQLTEPLEQSIAALARIGRLDLAYRFADRLEEQAMAAKKGDADSEVIVLRLAQAAAVSLKLGQKQRANRILRKAREISEAALEATIKPGDFKEGIGWYEASMFLAKLSVWPDKTLAAQFLRLAERSSTLEPRLTHRSIKLANLARRFTELGRFKIARDLAESAPLPVAENTRSDDGDEEERVYARTEVQAGGVVGSYLAVLDVYVSTAFPAKARLFGVMSGQAKAPQKLIGLQ